MESTVLKVSDCIALINQTLEYAYPTVIVEGEVASFKVSKGKFVFFDLKDDEGVLGCFMMVYGLRHPIEDGMRVRIIAQPKLTPWGKFSLTVREVLPVGEGSIKRAFELLKNKLAAEGLFDPERKRQLPSTPHHIGLIASVESAGYADFLKILEQRWSGLDIIVADVQVQGATAASQIIGALQHFNQQADPVDVVVLVRGGGSAEDLSVFNDEPLVRALAASRVPTMVGVGHETDTSLCDLVADLRAATPTNAAQLLVPDRSALLKEVIHKKQLLLQRLEAHSAHYQGYLRQATTRMGSRLIHLLQLRQQQVLHAERVLHQLDPATVLRRGYALVRNEQGNILHGSPRIGVTLTIETAESIVRAGVEDVQKK